MNGRSCGVGGLRWADASLYERALVLYDLMTWEAI